MLTEYSEKQRQAARMLARPDDHRTLREMSELLEVPVSTLCRWRNDPKFQSYLQQLTERYTTPQGERQRIWEALWPSAEGGNVSAIKLYFELSRQMNEQDRGEEDESLLEALRQGAKEVWGHVPAI